ncbi:restriction endonuclease subunit S [Sarcina ventriculi]|uniref:restriction endonuclease subunit S n=1 Tax=Sarcina ventriculi TaxID=1267 RepID=UPI001C0FB06B|nr:restriction endonuclease subunit S [Sarcina ventriculi]MBU5323557.1 restriction endonuclease subunit S [Sarcina ventriculi]
MPKMRYSGTDWLGEIPVTWELSKISGIYELRAQKVSDRDYPPLSVTMQGIVPQLETVAKTNAHDDRKLVKKGDFAINSRSDRRGSCGISDYDGSVSLINIVMKPRDEMNPSYYNWLFHTVQFADEFYKWGHGIVDDLWTTNWQDMKNINIPVPPIEEQEKIALFLDSKCTEIDSLYADIEKQVQTLEEYKKSVITEAVTKGLNHEVEMKYSGIKWIGYTPKNWEIIRLKYASWLKGRIGWQGLRADEFIEDINCPYLITGTDFNEGFINWDTCVHITEDRYFQDFAIHIREDDLLITKDGTIGKVAVAKNCPEKVSLNSGVFIIRNTGKYKYNDRYMYYLLQSEQFTKWYDLSNSGNSTIKHLNQEKFYNFQFTYPDITTQIEIATYLDNKCRKIDIIIKEKKEQLNILNEYKKSIIYEYVTGKKEVPVK